MKFTVILFFLFVLGCGPIASDEEVGLRQLLAFDLSGSYTTTADSETSLQFDVKNDDGNHSIIVTLTLPQVTIDKEKAVLNSLLINVSLGGEESEKNVPITSIFTEEQINTVLKSSIVLGGGSSTTIYADSTFSPSVDGGGNISEDLGATSEFRACADELITKKSAEHGVTVSLRYCLEGTAQKEGNEISGELNLSYSVEGENEDKERVFSRTENITWNPYTAPYKYKAGKVDLAPCLEGLSEEDKELIFK